MRLNLLAIVPILSVVSLLALELPKDPEVGVYIADGSAWTEAPVEIVNWKSTGAVKNILTDGIVKEDLNGRIHGGASPVAFPHAAKLQVLIHTTEGTAAEEYQLLKLRSHNDVREFRSLTGAAFHVSGGAQRDLLPWKATHVAPRMWRADLSDLPDGEYGFLSPVNTVSLVASAKIYTFEIGKCENCRPARAAVGPVKAVGRLFLNRENPAFDFK